MKSYTKIQLVTLGVAVVLASSVNAAFIEVGGPNNSSDGAAAAIVAMPALALDSQVTNMAMQGFDEKQGVLSGGYTADGGSIAAGIRVDSHMIFLNSKGSVGLQHVDVEWTFSGNILGVMSDVDGNFEFASLADLGAVPTN